MARGRTAGLTFRQVSTPRPLTRVVDLDRAATILLRAIEDIQRARSCGAYLFVDPGTRRAFVVAEDRAWMQQCLREFHRHAWRDWFVGYYTHRRPADPRVPMLKPTLAGLIEDIGEHLG